MRKIGLTGVGFIGNVFFERLSKQDYSITVSHDAYKTTASRVGVDEAHTTALIKYWKSLNNRQD